MGRTSRGVLGVQLALGWYSMGLPHLPRFGFPTALGAFPVLFSDYYRKECLAQAAPKG